MKDLALFRDYQVKLVVLVVAIFIWFYVITENIYDHSIDVPIVITSLSDDKVVINPIPKRVKLKVRGTGKSLIALSMGGIAKVVLDLTDVETRRTFVLSPKDVTLSRQFTQLQIQEIVTPDTVTVVLADYRSKRVPIRPLINPHLAPGYTRVGDIETDPDSITVSGAAPLIANIESVATVAREYDHVRFDFSETIPLDLPPDGVAFSHTEVRVTFGVQQLVEITLSGIPVAVINVPRTMTVYPVPSTLSLVLEGGGVLLQQLNQDDVRAYIDYRRARRNPAREHPVTLEVPPGIRYRDVKPRTFRLVFEDTPN